MLKQLALVLLIGLSIFLSGGGGALGPFLHAEAGLLVFGGTFLLVWSTYPLDAFRKPEPLTYASNCALWLGVLTTVIDLVVHLWNVNAIQGWNLKLATSLVGFFYGVLLSKVILLPIAERARGTTSK